jgi:hypothetical protein
MKRRLTIALVALALLASVAGVGVPQAYAGAPAPPTAPTGGVAPIAGDQNAVVPVGGAETSQVMGTIMGWIVTLFAWLLGVAAITLNWVMYYTVVTMGSHVGQVAAIGLTWSTLRDIGNIILIFGFLAAGIGVILNVSWYSYDKKMLPMLLIVAVFINFSLFVSEAVIDVGNLFATQFYTQIVGQVPSEASLQAMDPTSEGISTHILANLGLTTIYGQARDMGTNNQAPVAFKGANPFVAGFMSILLFIIAAFVIFSLAFILIARYIVLIILIIIAPIGFAGLVVPKLGGLASKWWNTLFTQTITAPVLLLLLYVALRVITDLRFLTGSGTQQMDWLGVQSNQPASFANVMLSFIIAMGLLLLVTLTSKMLGAKGGDAATKWAGRLSFGATALGAGALIGGSAYGTRRLLQRYAPNSRAARVASRGLRAVERARLDARSIPGVGAGMAAMGAGEGAAPVAKSAMGRATQGAGWWKKSTQESDRAHDQATRIPRLRAAIAANDHAQIGRLIGNMSDKELEESNVHQLIASSPAAAAALPQNRFDKLMSSELSDRQKNDLRTQRTAGFMQRYTTLDGTPARGRGPGANEFRHPATHVNPALRNQPEPSVRNPGTNMTNAEFAVRNLTNEAASQLPDAVLSEPDVYENLSLRQLNAISTAGRIQDSTATTIGAFLRNDMTFTNYFYGRNVQQQQDLNAFWHTNLPIGGANAASNQPPPGYQQNPGGNVLVPSNVGSGPRPPSPPPSTGVIATP